MDKQHLFVISHDAEPDDVSFLRIFLFHLKFYKNPTVYILVGEGNIPQAKIRKTKDILEAAVGDGILSISDCENIKVLGGSSAKPMNDFVHNFYANSFEIKPTDNVDVDKSRGDIISAIIDIKKRGGIVIIFGLKPFTDLLDVVGKTKSVLNKDDYLFISGSYNFREVKKDSVRINSVFNDGLYNTVVFEAFTTYEKNGLPKEIMHSSHVSISKLADLVREDKSRLGSIHQQLINGWNSGVAYDCIVDCAKPIIAMLETTGMHKDAVFALKSYVNALDYMFVQWSKPIVEIVLMFKNAINKHIFAGEEILTGKERFEADYHKDFVDKFPGLDLSNFNWNWKVLCVIAEDPYEMLIGDATLAMYFWKPELFTITKGRVTRKEDSNYTLFEEDSASNTSLITGIPNYEVYVNALKEGLNV